ncbi:hypothetical protein CLU79DRAFT_891445 [Phycomyces nitens]|nr:hypothetical protein CLU79DRAFT_891445 [Phycomyces nitens]
MGSSYGDSFAITNPLFLVTGILVICGWLITFVGACAAGFLGVGWWMIIYNLFFIIGVWTAVGVNRFIQNRHMILVFLTISIVYMTSLIQIFLDNTWNRGNRAGAGGAVIMIIMEFLWIFLLASNEDSWIINKTGHMNNTGIGAKPMIQNRFGNSGNSNVHPQEFKQSPLPNPSGGQDSYTPRNANSGQNAPPTPNREGIIQSKALHSYTGSPEDPNELSFEKGESLEIIDRSGNWWRAKKHDGSEGIVPSNYFSS